MYSSKEDLLNKAKNLLQDEMTSISFNTWIKSLSIESVNDNKIIHEIESILIDIKRNINLPLNLSHHHHFLY